MAAELSGMEEDVVGVTCLAEGADQAFALAMLAGGGRLHAVIPSRVYENSFQSDEARSAYHSLLQLATYRSELEFSTPGEDAYLAAGQEVADQSDILLAVWDGKPAGGKGGTADIVTYAQQQGVEVRIIWPPGSTRE
ncbi:hypothetical protein [Streptomyces sp. SID2888]|uniref:hypothetical protein n=1 Tax=Streptomyces sp. SID2888 TaxID=2690256 RepID=UPI00136ABF22|nr:hypothetical protein [Streptomyces sp. SID2888]MYV48070.1 hypothetical protein [Streptomyces sp. SID2888]